MNKTVLVFKIVVECIWFAMSVCCIFIAAKEMIGHNFSQGLLFAALSLAALFFFLYRRAQRKKAQQ